MDSVHRFTNIVFSINMPEEAIELARRISKKCMLQALSLTFCWLNGVIMVVPHPSATWFLAEMMLAENTNSLEARALMLLAIQKQV